MKLIKCFLAIVVALVVFVSCSDDEGGVAVPITNLTLNFELPTKGFTIDKYSEVKVVFTELNTKVKTNLNVDKFPLSIELPQGSYEVSVDGLITYRIDGNLKEGKVGAFVSELTLTEVNQTEDVRLVLKSMAKDLIIEEIFFTGTRTPEKKLYLGDKYFKLYNNTDAVIYADGLIIGVSALQTVHKQDVKPNIMDEAFTAGAMIQLPGTGNTYPVKPGESIVIAIDAINHNKKNPNSIDMTKVSDFELFYQGTGDVDNPSVPNVINFYDRVLFNDRGFHSYVLVRLPKDITKDVYLRDYKYDYNWIFESNGLVVPMDESDMKIPNNWIVDAVNLSVETEFQWLVTDASLDSGWTYCGKFDQDESRMKKSVRRKVLQEVNGVRLLKDTNNSTLDFDAEQVPSLFEN